MIIIIIFIIIIFIITIEATYVCKVWFNLACTFEFVFIVGCILKIHFEQIFCTLTNCSYFVKIDSSSPCTLKYANVLSRVLSLAHFSLLCFFISSIAYVINPSLSNTNNLLSFHQYDDVDDTQLYIGTNPFYTGTSSRFKRILHPESPQLLISTHPSLKALL